MTTPIIIPELRVREIVKQMQSSSLLVVGDIMLDEYVWGDVRRISPEAPVPVLAVESETARLGGAANVIQNISSVGAHAKVISICGNDDKGKIIFKMLGGLNCSLDGIYVSGERFTTTKTRLMARTQQIVRADRETVADLNAAETEELWSRTKKFFGSIQGVILSDYAKGVISRPLIDKIIDHCHNNKIYVAVDPKDRHFDLYNGVSVITPNLKEAHVALGVPYKKCSDDEVRDLGFALIDKLHLPYLLLTLSERGMALFDAATRSCTVLPTEARHVFDVTGAGDTVISIYSCAIVAGATPIEAAYIANHAAGLTVAEIGTASVTAEQLIKACCENK